MYIFFLSFSKVFHVHCHIPTLTHIPTEHEKWQCMLCTDLDNLDTFDSNDKSKRKLGLASRDIKVAQRILLELYCNYEASQPFRELVDREVSKYLPYLLYLSQFLRELSHQIVKWLLIVVIVSNIYYCILVDYLSFLITAYRVLWSN